MTLPRFLQYTIGSTKYSLPLVEGKGVHILPKPQRGDVIATVGTLTNETRLNAPLVISDIKGIGVSRIIQGVTEGGDERAWEMKNIDRWRGVWCLGPKAQDATDVTGVHSVTGSTEAISLLFYFCETAADDREVVAYLVGSTQTWTSCTATADWKATTTNAQFPCTGMAEFQSASIANLSAVALRQTAVSNGGSFYQLMYSGNGTTWTAPNHVNAADTPAGNTTDTCKGLIHILGTLYTLSYNTTTKVVTLRQSTDGITWTTPAGGGGLKSNAAPRALVMQFDYAGVLRPFVYLQEGGYYWTGTGFGEALDYRGDIRTNNGKSPVRWPVDGVAGSWNVSPQGRAIVLQGWQGNTSSSLPIAYNIAPTDRSQGLPGARDGLVTNLAAARNFLWAVIGGDSSTSTCGIYRRDISVAADDHGLGWIGPLYSQTAANVQIRHMWFSTLDDGVARIHIAVDSGTANDTDLVMMENVTSDPRTVTSYKHAASGTLILPKNNRGLPDVSGIWRTMTITGTAFSANNKVSAVYASGDAAVLHAGSSWGTTLGAITASGGSVNFAGTPTGTGTNAKEMQLRIDLGGASDASCYVEAVVVAVEKMLPAKRIMVFTVDMTAPVGTQAGMTSQKRLDDIEALRDASTYASVAYGQESSLIMKMYKESQEYMDYINLLLRTGTGAVQTDIKELKLALVEVD